MYCIVIGGMSDSTIFSSSSHKWHDFWEKVIQDKMCAFIFPTTFARNISHCKRNSGTYYHKYESGQHHPVALVNH